MFVQEKDSVEGLYSLQKRPFCNAFSGCGRKRASFSSNVDNSDIAANDALMQFGRKVIQEARNWEILTNQLSSNEATEFPRLNLKIKQEF
ncbi:hypothetical protein B4U80_10557 [Leptotrombidium deliense]|uniref:Uncharacterized protein n=1 Tax=Leptotrombidium deliense TaxID=299467 RepID=A0A443S268_9ACAR|nr:hypothetical protein B4U80_10557 [Leptotrombidium deliense]